MKLDPDKFTTADSVRKLLTYLEKSPLGRMPVPDAGIKMGTYYRKLQRRRGETVGAFLVREDHAYDEMKNALEKLVDQQVGAKKEATAQPSNPFNCKVREGSEHEGADISSA